MSDLKSGWLSAADEYPDQTRNLNPTPEAKVAMIIWCQEYAHEFRGGSMDFWDQLSEGRKRRCKSVVAALTAKERG